VTRLLVRTILTVAACCAWGYAGYTWGYRHGQEIERGAPMENHHPFLHDDNAFWWNVEEQERFWRTEI